MKYKKISLMNRNITVIVALLECVGVNQVWAHPAHRFVETMGKWTPLLSSVLSWGPLAINDNSQSYNSNERKVFNESPSEGPSEFPQVYGSTSDIRNDVDAVVKPPVFQNAEIIPNLTNSNPTLGLSAANAPLGKNLKIEALSPAPVRSFYSESIAPGKYKIPVFVYKNGEIQILNLLWGAEFQLALFQETAGDVCEELGGRLPTVKDYQIFAEAVKSGALSPNEISQSPDGWMWWTDYDTVVDGQVQFAFYNPKKNRIEKIKFEYPRSTASYFRCIFDR